MPSQADHAKSRACIVLAPGFSSKSATELLTIGDNEKLMFLAAADLKRLTGKVRYSAQRRALDALGVRYTKAATGEPLVLIEALDAPQMKARNSAPHWDRIGQ